MQKINLSEKFASFRDRWSPKVVGDLNDHQIKLVKLQGDFVWHHHEAEDELFLVVKGTMRIALRDGDVELSEGELFVVPKGTEHRPSAEEECWVLLLEPRTTRNTGNLQNDRTVERPERI